MISCSVNMFTVYIWLLQMLTQDRQSLRLPAKDDVRMTQGELLYCLPHALGQG